MPDARRRLAILTAPLEPPPTFEVIDYDVPPPPPEEIVYIDRPAPAFGDPEFDFLAAATPAGLLSAAAAGGFRGVGAAATADRAVRPAAAALRADPGLFRPPRYVAPPPNNIIYANIHNTAAINNVINHRLRRRAPATDPGPNFEQMQGDPSSPVAPRTERSATRRCRPPSRNGRP